MPRLEAHNEASFSPNLLCLRVAQMPRSRDMAILWLYRGYPLLRMRAYDTNNDGRLLVACGPDTLQLAHVGCACLCTIIILYRWVRYC
jgi:hypothetical protein